MDKLKRVLSGNDDTASDENRGIMGDVGVIIITKKTLKFNKNLFKNTNFVIIWTQKCSTPHEQWMD